MIYFTLPDRCACVAALLRGAKLSWKMSGLPAAELRFFLPKNFLMLLTRMPFFKSFLIIFCRKRLISILKVFYQTLILSILKKSTLKLIWVRTNLRRVWQWKTSYVTLSTIYLLSKHCTAGNLTLFFIFKLVKIFKVFLFY